MKTLFIFCLMSMTTFSTFASTPTDYPLAQEYSRDAVKIQATGYLAQHLNTSYEVIQLNIDEIVVNDQYGIVLFAVEVYLKNGEYYVIEFSGLKPLRFGS